MVDADMGTWYYGYDALGNLTSQTDARGCISTLNYDLLNRMTGKSFSGTGCGSTTSVTYAYDNYTAFPEYTGSTSNAIGRRTGMYQSDASDRSMWTYDTRGRLTREQKVVGTTDRFLTQWGYNSADLTTQMTYPGGNNYQAGEVVSFTYHPQILLNTATGLSTYVKSTS